MFLLILVIHNDGTAIADSLHNICRITDVLLSSLGAEGSFRVCRVLKKMSVSVILLALMRNLRFPLSITV